ncbi:hypothetical protein BN164_940070 [Clostridioides difficile T20]|nr:hypothetical protein BN163_290004 [Clostridioides difficile T5]CCK93941.1 hypothetical protein BN164_940070 [Clostridioides difficile T20]
MINISENTKDYVLFKINFYEEIKNGNRNIYCKNYAYRSTKNNKRKS